MYCDFCAVRCGSVSSSVCVTFSGVVNVGGTGCLLTGISLRVRGVCHAAPAPSPANACFWFCCCCCCCCCCWGSLYCARGSARNGVSGFGFVEDGCVVRPALNIGRRATPPLNRDRESILVSNAGFSVCRPSSVVSSVGSNGKDFLAQVAAWAAAVTWWWCVR